VRTTFVALASTALLAVALTVPAIAEANGATQATGTCPARPSAVELAGIDRSTAVACYGRRAIAVTVFVAPPGGIDSGVGAWVIAPAWLDVITGALVQPTDALVDGVGAGPALLVHIPPRLGTCGPTLGGLTEASRPFAPYLSHWVGMMVHLDDASAASCRAAGTPPPTRAEARRFCAEELVLDRLVPPGSVPATDAAPVIDSPSPAPTPAWPLPLALGLFFGVACLIARASRRAAAR
jgi:hypothetical protein